MTMKDTKIRKIEKNVLKFIDKTSKSYAMMQEERFSQELYYNLQERGLASPIEDIFFIAIRLQCHEMLVEFEPAPIYNNSTDQVTYPDGIYIDHQVKVGSYNADFMITHIKEKESHRIIVEVDGHDFHDKNKYQRAYEKSRDRFFLKSGFKVFHYTGSEVVNDPHRVAFEVLKEIGFCFWGETLDDHDPNNCLGWEDA